MQRTSTWRPSTRMYYRISIVFLLCLTALAFGAVSIFDGTAAAGSAEATQESKGDARAAEKASPAASAALETLKRARGVGIKARVARETGSYDFVRAADGQVLAVDNTSSSPEERAFDFLRERGALVGMNAAERQLAGTKVSSDDSTSASVLKVARVLKDSIGASHVRMNQFYKGLPVFGAQVIVHMNDRGITAISGHYVPDVKIPTKASLTAAEAATSAARVADSDLKIVKTELSIYRKGLLEGYRGQSVLAYSVELTDGKSRNLQIWVDAMKGTILNRIELSHPAINRTIFTPDYDPLFAVRQEGDPLTPGATPGTTGADPINNLYVMAGHTYNMFSSGFGRDSYDGLGHKMDSVYLVNDKCPNAYWNGISTNYCPDFDADDVVSHEWGHAYTQFTHGLIYSFQSGALNESYSDIFGESADLLNGVDAEGGSNNSQPNPDGQRWQMGEDVPTLSAQQLGILRDMWTPTRYGDPDKVSSDSYACGSGDGGGVHTNSGVPNHAYAMLVDGKTFNGQTVQGIGFDRALAIYYRAMTVYQTPTTNFAQHAEALRASCNDLIGQPLKTVSTSSATGSISPDVINAGTCVQVNKAIAAVEMEAPPPCNMDPVLDPDTPASCDGATSIFTEDWETGDDGWSRTSTGVFAEWEDSTRNLRDFTIDSTLPKGRAGSAAYAANIPLGNPGGGTCEPGTGDYSGQYTIDSPTITLPGNANIVKLNFDHYVATEATFDGGQVEVSVNSGAFQLVPQSDYVHNAPNSQLEAAPPVGLNTNPNAGEFAWHGTNIGTQEGSWGTTIVDLSALTNPGDTVKLRFTYSQDGCNGVDGWYVDNINLYFCPPLEAPALSLGADYENPDTNGSYTLNWTRPSGATGPDVLQQSTTCGPLMSDDAENGLGQWTAASSDLVAPMWQTSSLKPQHSSTAFWANPLLEQETQNTSATLTFNNQIQIPASGITTLNFSEWYFNEEDDHGYIEVSEDGTTWIPIYDNNRNGYTEDGALALAEEDLKAKQLDLTIYSGKSIRLRLRFALGQSNFFLNTQYGWYVDDISITNDSFTNVVSTSGMSHTVSGVPNGTRCYRVRTTYTFGSQLIAGPYSSPVSATVETNFVPPTVSITSPADGATFPTGSNITITADANDTDGTVTKVEFYEGANKIGEDTTGPSPYSFTWNNVAAGSYTLSAKATDNDGATATSDPVSITVTDFAGSECVEDDDPRIAYTNGWHLGNDPNASAGHFRYNTGKDIKHGVSFQFSVPAGKTGKVTYYFARSTKDGTADIYLDGAFKESINYKGAAGSMQHPEFREEYKVSYNGLGEGSHTLEIRNPRQVVFIDRICLENSSSNAQPTTGPGTTTNGNSTTGGGQSTITNYPMQSGAKEISVIAGSNLGVPFQLILISPSGLALETVNSSSGLATINRPVTQKGIYAIKVVNLSVGPVQITTAATPLVQR